LPSPRRWPRRRRRNDPARSRGQGAVRRQGLRSDARRRHALAPRLQVERLLLRRHQQRLRGTGDWHADDGKLCSRLRGANSSCNEVREVGEVLYLKRDSDEVIALTPK
jgi:hypothetical protein